MAEVDIAFTSCAHNIFKAIKASKLFPGFALQLIFPVSHFATSNSFLAAAIFAIGVCTCILNVVPLREG